MTLITAKTGFYNLSKANEIADYMNKSDLDWTYNVIDCENGLGRIDIYDEDSELVIEGFIL